MAMKALLLLCGAGLACAQPQLEIRGTVVEAGLGIAGATVTLYEFGHTPAEATTRKEFATVFTDGRGSFQFHPERTGQYYLEAKKYEYVNADWNLHGSGMRDMAGESVELDAGHPAREFRLALTRLGELRGRVIDENGTPMAGLRLTVHPAASTPSPEWAKTVADKDGYFTAPQLKPGSYLVRIMPQRATLEVVPQFSSDDLNIVDQDLETSEWPGGGEERSATPVPVTPGSSAGVGTITVRKAQYYRARVSVLPNDCQPGEKWSFAAIQPAGPETPYIPTLDVPCTKEFLVRNLSPGAYLFALTSGRNTETNKWAHAPVQITRENVQVALTMFPGMDIDGRVTTADGNPLPPAVKMRIAVMPDIQGFADSVLFGARPATVDARGRFLIKGLQGDRHRVTVDGPGGNYYVKEIRHNGSAAVDGLITLGPGAPAQLEIVIDDKSASITGLVTDGGKAAGEAVVAVVKWPVPAGDNLLSLLRSVRGAADDQGRFRIDGLQPGEYRILALPRDVATRLSPESFIPLLNRGEKVTVERGSSQSISLKIVQP